MARPIRRILVIDDDADALQILTDIALTAALPLVTPET